MIYIANVEYSTYSGIFKKIESHAKHFSKIYGKCLLICKEENNILELEYRNGERIGKINHSVKFTMKNVHSFCFKKTINTRVIYYRNMIKPSLYQLLFFIKLKLNKKKIIFEIPTYPYFKEQVSTSNNKILTTCKLLVELIFYPLIYNMVDIVPIILSNNKKKTFKKNFLIRNGIDKEKYSKTYQIMKSNPFRFIGVGTLYSYHGYDRLIKSIALYNGDKRIEFNIIGDGPAITELKNLVRNLNLENSVYFLGRIEGPELDNLLMKSNIGVGSLTLFRRGANIDTTLKMVDYLCRGLPTITSGLYEDDKSDNKIIYKVSNDLEMIDIDKVLSFYESLDATTVKNSQNEYLEYYSWENILDSILLQIGE